MGFANVPKSVKTFYVRSLLHLQCQQGHLRVSHHWSLKTCLLSIRRELDICILKTWFILFIFSLHFKFSHHLIHLLLVSEAMSPRGWASSAAKPWVFHQTSRWPPSLRCCCDLEQTAWWAARVKPWTVGNHEAMWSHVKPNGWISVGEAEQIETISSFMKLNDSKWLMNGW